jgi:hypothetical protein
MRRFQRTLIPVIALAVTAIVAYPLYAQAVHQGIAAAKEILKAMDEHKITLVKAVEVAEKHADGKPVQAAVLMHGKDLMFDVYCVKGDKIMLVTVDGKTGKATKSEEVKEIGGKPEKAAEHKAVKEKEKEKGAKPAPGAQNKETPKKK